MDIHTPYLYHLNLILFLFREFTARNIKESLKEVCQFAKNTLAFLGSFASRRKTRHRRQHFGNCRAGCRYGAISKCVSHKYISRIMIEIFAFNDLFELFNFFLVHEFLPVIINH